jgi:hypothetical protein
MTFAEDVIRQLNQLDRRVGDLETLDSVLWAVSGYAPADAQFVTMALDGDLSAERVLTATAPISLADGGAEGNATLTHDTSGVGAGTYTVVTVDVTGHVTVGTTLSASDLPAHTHSGAAQGGSLVIGTTDTDATAGSVLFAGTAGVIQEDNTNFTWDDTNNQLYVSGLVAPTVESRVRSALTTGVGNSLAISHETSAEMIDAFGAGILFQVEDATSGNQPIAYIAARRNSADNSGDLALVTYSAGTPTGSAILYPTGDFQIIRDFVFAGTGFGITHVDGNTAGYVLRGDNTRFVPAQLNYTDLAGTAPVTAHVHSAAAGQGGATISATTFDGIATVSAVWTHSANLILDDVSSDSPQLQFIGGSNNDTIYFYLDDDAGAGNSDLRMVLVEAAGASRFYIADSELSDVFQVHSDGTVIANGRVSVGPNAAAPAYTLEAIENQNAVTRVQVENTTSDTAARVQYLLTAGGNSGNIDVFSSGYTTSGTAIADSMRIFASSIASAGLNLVTDTTADISFYTNSTLAMTVASGGNVTIPNGNLDINGNDLILDADADSYLHEVSDDRVAFVLAGASGRLDVNINSANDFWFVANNFNVGAGSRITMGDDTSIGLGTAAGRVVFDSTPSPDLLTMAACDVEISGGDLILSTAGSVLAVGVSSTETGTVIQAERDDGGVGWFVETNTFGTARDVLPTGAVDRGIQFGSIVYNVTDGDGPTFTNTDITYSGVSNQNVTIYSGGGATVILEVNTDGSCYVSQTAGSAKSLEVCIRYAFL